MFLMVSYDRIIDFLYKIYIGISLRNLYSIVKAILIILIIDIYLHLNVIAAKFKIRNLAATYTFRFLCPLLILICKSAEAAWNYKVREA